MVLIGTKTVKEHEMVAGSKAKARSESGSDSEARERILEAAFSAFVENGSAKTSTLEIATRARVSKRELYALVGNKQEMLVACIGERAKRMDLPADLPVPRDRETLAEVLASFGAKLVAEISDPVVVAVFRLAIAEAAQAPEVARTLNAIGREASRAALGKIMTQARSHGLLTGSPTELAARFNGLLWGDLMVSLLLGVAERPKPREISARALAAAEAFLQLHSRPAQA